MYTKKSVCDRLVEVKQRSQERSRTWRRDVLLEDRGCLHQVNPPQATASEQPSILLLFLHYALFLGQKTTRLPNFL